MFNKFTTHLPFAFKISLKKFWHFLQLPYKLVHYYQDWRYFAAHNDQRFLLRFNNAFWQLDDKTTETAYDAHYIYHPAWAARVIAQYRPQKHVDIASTLAFSTMLSAFVPTSFYDYRPALLNLSNLKSGVCDLVNLPFADNSLESLSCLHTLEHVGLGRYGDALSAQGDVLAMRELIRVLAPGGNLLIVVPVGKSKLMFNAHRIYSFAMINKHFADLDLQDFSLITDNGQFINSADPSLVEKQDYGCGCFWYSKPL